ncbi:TRM11 family methyltransferase [Mycoplasmopsis iners]|uniref:hypothetical protein n=1 Tax=Mycoplasmopsis iners TaxID=76630 RepID=UPI000498191A|nr:hypothetical protein [Mycoplasmopsis iners]
MNTKIKLGQFFTVKSLWLKPQIKDFINQQNRSIVYDPFAGKGDLLNVAKTMLNFKEIIGLDIDSNLNWNINDSLIKIPIVKNALILTNPPYLAKQSAKRKNIDHDNYFSNSIYNYIYLISLEKMLDTGLPIVAIIPESFINSNFKNKHLLHSITIIEDDLFDDTENPVIVACFDNLNKDMSKVKIFKNDFFIGYWEQIFRNKLVPVKNIQITFNSSEGWLGLKAIDGIKNSDLIRFDFKNNFDYDWQNKIKETSRHFTLIDLEIDNENKSLFINECNRILNNLRNASFDVILTPFKGNNKSGKRRRRLDFKLARAIMEQAYLKITKKKNN